MRTRFHMAAAEQIRASLFGPVELHHYEMSPAHWYMSHPWHRRLEEDTNRKVSGRVFKQLMEASMHQQHRRHRPTVVAILRVSEPEDWD